MDYEEKTVFKCGCANSRKCPEKLPDQYILKHHDQVGEKLTELKNIIIKYCPAKPMRIF